MRVLVTGGAGFIGSHFAKRLQAAGDDVRVLDALTYSGNPANLEGTGIELTEGNICDADTVAEAAAGCGAIVNFAAETHVDRSILGATDFGRTEFFGTQVLLEEVRRSGARFVQVSTDEVYGDLAAGGSSVETDPIKPSSPYSVAKAAGDLHIPAYARTFGVNASITRGSNTYGPHQYPEKLIPLMTTNALEGELLPIYGDGKQIRDWLWVEDHCAGIETVLREGAPGEVYNVGGDDERENVEIVRHILRLTGADESLIRHVEDRAGHDRRYSLDTSKLRGLGWAPQKKFEEGIAETVAWYLANRTWWEPIKSGEYRRYYEKQYAARLAGSWLLVVAFAAAALRLTSQLPDLLQLALQLLRAVEQLEHAVATSEREAREGEVVGGVGLRELARAREPCDRLLEQRQRTFVVAGLHEREALVVQLRRARGGGASSWVRSSARARPSSPS